MMDGEDTGVELKESSFEEEENSFMAILQVFQEHWLGSFILNLLGYALIILPAALLIRRWKKDPQIKEGL